MTQVSLYSFAIQEKDLASDVNSAVNVLDDFSFFYKGRLVVDALTANTFWFDMDNYEKETHFIELDFQRHFTELAFQRHFIKTLTLSFDFPFYGSLIRELILMDDGLISLHIKEPPNRNISPFLKRDFLLRIDPKSAVRYVDNGSALTVQWGRIQFGLQHHEAQFGQKGRIDYQATLHDNGQIVFIYWNIPLLELGTIPTNNMDKIEYHPLRKSHKSNSDTAFVLFLDPKPVCLALRNCSSCIAPRESMNSQLNGYKNCFWCVDAKKCSNNDERLHFEKFECDRMVSHCPNTTVPPHDVEIVEHTSTESPSVEIFSALSQGIFDVYHVIWSFLTIVFIYGIFKCIQAIWTLCEKRRSHSYTFQVDPVNLAATHESLYRVQKTLHSERSESRESFFIVKVTMSVQSVRRRFFSKLILIIVIAAVATKISYADAANPDSFNKSWKKTWDDIPHFYDGIIFKDEILANELWINMNAVERETFHDVNQFQLITTLDLGFDFSFYGKRVRRVAVLADGFVTLRKNSTGMFAFDHYITPFISQGFHLTANVDDSDIKWIKTGTSMTVQWQNLSTNLPFKTVKFSFQATLHQNGTIVFVYKDIPLFEKDLIQGIKTPWHNPTNFQSSSVLVLKPKPLCIIFRNCESCTVSQVITNECFWCPNINKCTRLVELEYLEEVRGCDSQNLIGESVECPSETLNFASSTTKRKTQPDINQNGNLSKGIFNILISPDEYTNQRQNFHAPIALLVVVLLSVAAVSVCLCWKKLTPELRRNEGYFWHETVKWNGDSEFKMPNSQLVPEHQDTKNVGGSSTFHL
ncbi:Hypothetical predicted protein [Cloeon dipterum]|uniref:PSI domain-containing protein n=1 Tax=Cloeon dipterum TaxID=197152 RepID=A0A8S1CKU9_9INSE|nr:Hypothetical predicted protein [Cloeon dipterum]